MSKTLEKVRRFISTHAMLDKASGVVVAVSGGPDSVALLDLLVQLSPINRLHVAHLDHKLRARESAEDAEFVRRLAERIGISITVDEADVRDAAEQAGRGIEEVARELRYDFLLHVARESGCDRIATGHTMSDQAETFLMRLARGAGLRGLSSMRPVMKAHTFSKDEGHMADESLCEARMKDEKDEKERAYFHSSSSSLHPLLIRPLLCITREEVEAYCRERSLEFRTDATNLNGDFTRNLVRRDVMPAMRAINPRVVESIARAAEIISSDEDALNHLASRLLDDARLKRGVDNPGDEKSETFNVKAGAYSAAALLEQPSGIRRRMLIEAIRRERAANARRNSAGAQITSTQITSTHIASVEGLLSEQASGKRIVLPDGLEAWREFDAIIFVASTRCNEPTGSGEYKFEIGGARTQIEAGGIHFSLERSQPRHLLEPIINQARDERHLLGRDWVIVALDESTLPDRLIIRPRRAGERARVIGQRKTKKLKNLMIDHRIPPSRRSAWPVVTTPDDLYVWSPGLPPAVEFAARDKSTCLAILRASNI
jgi:tRNA(Ile)-lysidine synthetase-like protein